jgi:hypothetical protein
MFKSCLLFCSSLIISNNAAAQTEIDSLIITRTIKNIVFFSNKTHYIFTRIIQHDGVFGFTDYPIDSIYKRNNIVEKSYFPNKTRYTKLIYKYLSNTDTIKNFFNGYSNQDLNENSTTIKKEVKFSYILAQLGESVLNSRSDSVFRIIRPCDELNMCNTYEIVRLNLNATKIKLYKVTGTSYDLKGIQIINKDSVFLKLKDVKKIYKLINEIKDLPYDDCLSNDVNPFLIECNIGTKYTRAILADDCLRKRTKKNLYLEILKKLNAVIVKYKPYECEEPPKILDFLTL